MKENNTKLSLGRIYYPVKTLGPGNRVGIWLRGCPLDCKGCISPELKIYDRSREVSADEITAMIKTIPSPVDGFTISGGEPFFKPQALSLLVAALSEINDDIIIFTGYTLKALKEKGDRYTDKVLENCSMLVDGPYIRELNDGRGLRGSSNQEFHIFRHRKKYGKPENYEREIQNILYNERIVIMGIPPEMKKNDKHC
jgi:anaerobic ribonucleoside-triphosphate reductase activating protein